jgi:hypothetical protein
VGKIEFTGHAQGRLLLIGSYLPDPLTHLLLTHLVGTGRLRQGRSAERSGNVGGGAAAGLTVERNPTTLGIFSAGSFGDAFDRD